MAWRTDRRPKEHPRKPGYSKIKQARRVIYPNDHRISAISTETFHRGCVYIRLGIRTLQRPYPCFQFFDVATPQSVSVPKNINTTDIYTSGKPVTGHFDMCTCPDASLSSCTGRTAFLRRISISARGTRRTRPQSFSASASAPRRGFPSHLHHRSPAIRPQRKPHVVASLWDWVTLTRRIAVAARTSARSCRWSSFWMVKVVEILRPSVDASVVWSSCHVETAG
jgi:hypothetical protein